MQVHSQVCNCCSICIKLLWCIQGISEDLPRAITAEGSNNHAENPSDEVVLNFLFFYSQFGAIDTFSRVLTKWKLLMNCYDGCQMVLGVIFVSRNCQYLQNTWQILSHWELIILWQMMTSRYSHMCSLFYNVTDETYKSASSPFAKARVVYVTKFSIRCISCCFSHEARLTYRNLWLSFLLQIQMLTSLENLIRR